MFDLPDTYRVDVKVALKDFIPKDLKPNDKKRIKDAVKSVRLDYQIAGEEIPSQIENCKGFAYGEWSNIYFN